MSRRREIWLAVLLLLVLFGLQVMSARLKSTTYDEQGHITRGYAFVKLADLHILTGTPILLNALNALPLLALPDLRLPVDFPSWAGTDFHPISEQFMWGVNENADQILFLARVPTMLLALLLALFVYRWARERFGPWGGLLSLVLCAFDPNVIAHGRLATTDLGATALTFVAAYWLWKLLRRPSWVYVWATGVFLGLAQASKFSTLLLGPIFALLFAVRALVPAPFALRTGRRRSEPPRQRWVGRMAWLLVAGLAIVLVAYLTLWATYGFQVGSFPGQSFPVLAPAHFEQFLDLLGRLTGEEGREAQAFLMGDLYVGGKWQYFPIAFLLKTPLPTLFFLVGALLLGARSLVTQRRAGPAGAMDWALWLPPLVFFGSSLTSELNLGYRYILPVLPFVFVLAGRMGQWLEGILSRAPGSQRALGVALVSMMVGWTVWSGVSIYPDYLAFFNEGGGGPDNGWRFLVDSNIDWGQDLKGLKAWMDRNGVDRVKLGYVGEARPAYYGIAFDPLPSSPDRWEHPLHHDLYPADPAPGTYAISVNLIQGRNLADPGTYAWFREREPVNKVGYSIFIYEVPTRDGENAVIALSGLVPADIRPDDYTLLATNNVHPLWFDEERSMVVPCGEAETFLLVTGDANPAPELSHVWTGQVAWKSTTRDGRSLQCFTGTSCDLLRSHAESLAALSPVWHLPATQFAPGDPDNHGKQLAYPVRFGDQVELLAYTTSFGSEGRTSLRLGGTLTVVTYWRITAANQQPLQIFVHLLDVGGTYRGGEDRLDVWYENWRAGDLFVQVHRVALDAGASPGEYQVEVGWYRPETMRRLSVTQEESIVADRVLLRAVEVK